MRESYCESCSFIFLGNILYFSTMGFNNASSPIDPTTRRRSAASSAHSSVSHSRLQIICGESVTAGGRECSARRHRCAVDRYRRVTVAQRKEFVSGWSSVVASLLARDPRQILDKPEITSRMRSALLPAAVQAPRRSQSHR